MPDPLQPLLDRIGDGERLPLTLLHGETVLAEPAAVRLAEALRDATGAEIGVHRRPPTLAPLLSDLATYSLFAPGRVLVVVESAVLADASAAASLIDEAAASLPVAADDELEGETRRAAGRLLQVLRLLQIDAGSPAEAIAALPKEVLSGVPGRGRRRRGVRQVETLREQLTTLLEAARREGLEASAEGDLAGLERVLAGVLPEGNALILAERAVAEDHPVVARLAERETIVHLGEISRSRDGWQGVDRIADQLEEETGIRLSRDAARELARRTLRGSSHDRSDRGVAADSAARFAAEYRKLATLVGDGIIEAEQVEELVADRGEEDVWAILDALGSGQGAEAVARLERLLAAAEDPRAALFSFFGLLSSYCRNLAAVAATLEVIEVPRGEASYGRFKARLAPRLQGELPDGGPSPLAGLHPFRLHRAYLAASRLDAATARRLPARLLETEQRLKGDSDVPDTALDAFLLELAAAVS